VSQYRLAAHLSSAVILYSLLFWNAKVPTEASRVPQSTVTLIAGHIIVKA
jgi:hypothetical protein